MISIARKTIDDTIELFKHREVRETSVLETYTMYESCKRAHEFLKEALVLQDLPESPKAVVKVMKSYVHELGWFGNGCLIRDNAIQTIARRVGCKAYGFSDKGSKYEVFEPLVMYLVLDLTYDEYLACYQDYKLLSTLCYPALIENLDGEDPSVFTAKLESFVV